jgi:hypothetical protein
LGFKGPGIQNQIIDDMIKSLIHTNKLTSIMGDWDLTSLASQRGLGATFDNMLRSVSQRAGVLTGAIEAFDRGHSVLAASEMALKRGMTASQAAYGIYDTILKNNFLGGALNPSWMKDPKLRAIFLFQNTPFKIWERRLVNAYRTGNSIKLAGKELKGSSLGDTIEQMKGLKELIRAGEQQFKSNLIVDAMNTEKDFFGTPVARQLVKEIAMSGLIVGAAGYLGLDLMPQVGHVPFLRLDRREATLNTAPVIKGALTTLVNRHQAGLDGKEPEFFVTDFVKNWLGSNGIVPITMHKLLRIGDNDIPDIYKDSPMQYFFSVPAK